MIDNYFKQYFWTFHLLVLFGAAFLLAKTVNAFIGKSLSTPAAEIVAKEKNQSRSTRRATTDRAIGLTAFLDRNIFKAAREDLAPEPETPEQEETGEFDPNNCEKSGLAANLLATIVTTDPESSIAVFQDTAKDEAIAYRVGDKVLDQGEIMLVDWREVRVSRNGRCELFSLEDEPSPSSPVASAAKPPPSRGKDKAEFGKGIKKTGDAEYEIPREEIDNVLSNLNQIATQARIVPSFHNGKANGFKLFSIRPNSLYSKIGIQNGDIIQRINGYEINSPDKALEIYQKLKDATSVSIDLVRRGKAKSMSYSIR